ncbi:MAG: hypothetical protein ACLGGX_11840 [Bdellovibrionia bacterium]
MSKKELSAEKQLLITAMLVLVGAGISYASLFYDFKNQNVAGESNQRQPASETFEKFQVSQKENNTRSLIQLKKQLCKIGDDTLDATKFEFVQLSGETCAKRPISEVSLRNMSNGHVATVFLTGTGKFQTDVIPLVKGENILKIDVSYSDGNVQNSSISLIHE